MTTQGTEAKGLGACVHGRVVVPGSGPGAALMAAVSVIDASCLDAPAIVVAKTVFAWPGPRLSSAPFCIRLPELRPLARRWIFDATVTADRAGKVMEGDYILVHALECPEKQEQELIIRLERIG